MNKESKENLLFDLLSHFLIEECSVGKITAIRIATRFCTLSEFLDFNFENLPNIKSEGGRKLFRISKQHIENIQSAVNLNKLDQNKSVQENYLMSIGRVFVSTQIKNISEITLEILNPNPFLIKALNFKDVNKFIGFIVFQRATRSIVTSFGFAFEKLLVASGAKKLPKGFDVLKEISNIEHYIQVKSGTSDMDKDQIIHWKGLIEEKEEEGHNAYIGMPYGKRDGHGLTIALMRQYLPDWEARTLIGQELWDFISGKNNYHEIVLKNLRIAATQILRKESIIVSIDKAIEKVSLEFIEKYNDDINAYISSLF